MEVVYLQCNECIKNADNYESNVITVDNLINIITFNYFTMIYYNLQCSLCHKNLMNILSDENLELITYARSNKIEFQNKTYSRNNKIFHVQYLSSQDSSICDDQFVFFSKKDFINKLKYGTIIYARKKDELKNELGEILADKSLKLKDTKYPTSEDNIHQRVFVFIVVSDSGHLTKRAVQCKN